MRGRLISAIAASTLLTAAVPIGCGYFLYPERRGNSGGSVDGATLVMDLLWLIPGVIPGVIALVVDFSSGAAYTGSHRHAAVVISPKGRVAVRLPAATQPTQVEARLVTTDRQVLARKITVVGPDVPQQSLELQVTNWAKFPRDVKIYLEVSTTNGTVRFPTAMQVSR